MPLHLTVVLCVFDHLSFWECMAKYELLSSNTIRTPDGRTLYRIRALRDFGNVNAGDIGGYVETAKNLAHHGLCWIFDDARVFADGYVRAGARIAGNAAVFDHARISDKARIFGTARISGFAEILGTSSVFENAQVSEHATIIDSAQIHGHARVDGYAKVWTGDIFGRAHLSGRVVVLGGPTIYRSHISEGVVDYDFKEVPERHSTRPARRMRAMGIDQSGLKGGPAS